MLEAIALVKHYGPVKAVDGISFSVNPGEVFGLLGHNGAGKTTTLRLLNGVLKPTSGLARVFGLSPVEDGLTVRRRSGVLTEAPSLEERLTARQNLRYYADLYGVAVPKVAARIEGLLQIFELNEVGDAKVGSFSKGMRQRLALARALLHEPELLYLDEPTAGLDPHGRREFHDLVKALSDREDTTILLTTHDLAEAERLAGRILVLAAGRIIANGSAEELARQIGREAQVRWRQDGVEHARATRDPTSFVRDLLTSGDDGVTDLEVRRPSLEETYLALVHEHEGGHELKSDALFEEART